MSFTGLLIVVATALAAPLLAVALSRFRMPSSVLEIVLGIIIGPSVLGWVHIDTVISVISTLGLSMLLFLAGLEVDLERFRGRRLTYAAGSIIVSVALALLAGVVLHQLGLISATLLVAVSLVATGLGLILPILQDAHELESDFGQTVIAAASVSEFTGILLLSLLFSADMTSAGAKLVLLAGFAVTVVVVGFGLSRIGMTMRLSGLLTRLQDTTAQIRIRLAVVLFVAFAALAARFGLETILGAFVAGVLLRAVDRDAPTAHPQTNVKLEAIGFGLLIPVFFVASGIVFNLHALLASASTLVLVPAFLFALLVVRGVPAVALLPSMHRLRAAAAGLLQATSLSFIVAATQIGSALGLLRPATAAGLVAAGVLSVILFPPVALALLARAEHSSGEPQSEHRAGPAAVAQARAGSPPSQ